MKRKLRLISMEEIDRKCNWTPQELKEIEEDALYNRVAFTIKEVRLNKKMTQELLAIRAKMPRSVISRIESGRKNMTLETLFRIANSMDQEVEIHFVNRQNPKIQSVYKLK
jgi:DNA-binding XRE family transcriptional regulator